MLNAFSTPFLNSLSSLLFWVLSSVMHFIMFAGQVKSLFIPSLPYVSSHILCESVKIQASLPKFLPLPKNAFFHCSSVDNI